MGNIIREEVLINLPRLYVCIYYLILEEGMVTGSRVLAWRIPWTEEPGRLQSIGLHRVGHN